MLVCQRLQWGDELLCGFGLLLQGAGLGAVLVVQALGAVFHRAAVGDFILQALQHRAQLGGLVGVRVVGGAANGARRVGLQGIAQRFDVVGAGGFGSFQGALGLRQRSLLGGQPICGFKGVGLGLRCALPLVEVLLRQRCQLGLLVGLLRA